ITRPHALLSRPIFEGKQLRRLLENIAERRSIDHNIGQRLARRIPPSTVTLDNRSND
ncbi:hypothetical protein L917_11959, partial [Phytophthora nicotianae]